MPSLDARTDAIAIMQLKRWFAPPDNKPTWAFVADAIISMHPRAHPIVDEAARIDWILQSWHESDAPKLRVPPFISHLVAVARKYNIAVNGRKISKDTKLIPPLWHHFSATNNFTWNKKAARCLRTNHSVKTVGDLLTWTQNPTQDAGCENIEPCERIAVTLQDRLPAKWNPIMNTPHRDGLDHTPRRKRYNMEADVTQEMVTFDPNVTETGHPHNLIRIFGTAEESTKRRQTPVTVKKPAYRLTTRNMDGPIVLYTDGSALENGTEGSRAGAGIWHCASSQLNKSIRLPGNNGSNQRAELVAVMEALLIEPDRNLEIYSDSRYVIDGILESLTKWEDNGWLDVANQDLWKVIAQRLRRRGGTTKFQWVKGHAHTQGNEEADTLAGEGARKDTPDVLDLTLLPEWQLSGARLSTMTQATAYGHAIKRYKKSAVTTRTTERLVNVQDALQDISGERPTQGTIWKSFRKDPVRPNIRDFLWKIAHDSVKCGRFFANIPKWEDKQYCICGEVESPRHMLLECTKRPVRKLWAYVKSVWNATKPQGDTAVEWVEPTYEILIGLNAIHLNDSKGKRSRSQTHKYKVMTSEALWIIWKLRCNDVVGENPRARAPEYEAQWLSALKEVIVTERTLAKLKLGQKHTAGMKNVYKTWGTNHFLTGSLEDGLPMLARHAWRPEPENSQSESTVADR